MERLAALIAGAPPSSRTRLGSVQTSSRSLDEKVWTELERRELIEAVVTFSTHPGPGGITHSVRLRSHRASFGYAPNCPTDDELQFALTEPVWARYGSFAGQPAIRGEVVWNVQDRRETIGGRRGDQRFQEEVE